jgi:putative cell wall-binding protein
VSSPTTKLWQRTVAAAASVAVVGSTLLAAPFAGATTAPTQDRIAGVNRYETAALIAEAAYPSGSDVAVVASGLGYADALAGAALAGLQNAPLLLTDPNALSDETAEELDFLGTTKVFLLGGTVAVKKAVEDELAESVAVTRLDGADRFDTAAKIATTVGAANVGSVNGLKTAIVATGLDFADALAGGPIAANAPATGVLPILLVHSDVPATTSAAISSLGIKQVIVLGGTSAVSLAVETKLVAATGNPVIRYAGTSRWETATKIADAAKSVFGFPVTTAFLANGTAANFADALAGGPLGGVAQAPVLLTDPNTLPSETSSWLAANRSTVTDVTALGGTSAVSQSVLDTAQAAATTPAVTRANETYTVAPSSTVTLTNGATRDFTATGLGTTAVDIALVACGNVTSSSGSTQFVNTNTNTVADGTQSGGSAPDAASTASRITAVNGTATPTNDDYANNIAPSSGQVTFTITGPTGANAEPSCVLPVVFADANADNGLNTSTSNPGAPTETFGTGGQTNFAPAFAPASTFGNVSVEFYSPGATQFSGCDYIADGPTGNLVNTTSCRTYAFDSGDSFQLDPSTPITITEFQSRLSQDDQVRGTYSPNGQSTFVLTDDSPRPPSNVTASRSATTPTSVTVSWSANPANGGADVTGYRVYRIEASTCPAFTGGGYALVSGGTVTTTSFVDTAADGAKSYCYTVTTVDHSDESDAATPVAVTSVPVFSSASINTARTTITLTYTKPVQCSSVDANGSSYTVKSGTATVSPSLTSCSGSSSATVTLTFVPALTSDEVAEHLTVTAKLGADGDTVRDANSQQPVGDVVTVGDAPRFVSASTTANSTVLTLTYSEAIVCSSAKPDDYTLEVTAGPSSPSTVPSTGYTVACVAPTNGASTKITITLTSGFFQKDQALKVTVKKGTDGNTVIDANEGRTQKQGDSTTTTVA